MKKGVSYVGKPSMRVTIAAAYALGFCALGLLLAWDEAQPFVALVSMFLESKGTRVHRLCALHHRYWLHMHVVCIPADA